MMNKKIIYGIDAVILVGTLLGLFFTFFYTNNPAILFSPSQIESGSSCVLLTFENNGPGTARISISDNLKFDGAQIYVVDNGLKINLAAGDYFIKVDGVFDSFPRKLKVDGVDISLEVVADGNLYKLINAGSGNFAVRETNERGNIINSYNLARGCGGNG